MPGEDFNTVLLDFVTRGNLFAPVLADEPTLFDEDDRPDEPEKPIGVSSRLVETVIVRVPRYYSEFDIRSFSLLQFREFERFETLYNQNKKDFEPPLQYEEALSEGDLVWSSPGYDEWLVCFEKEIFDIFVLGGDDKAELIHSKWYEDLFQIREWSLPADKKLAFQIIRANPDWCTHCSQPWLDYIESGNKTVEGRLNKGKFPWMDDGDTIVFYHDKIVKKTIKTMCNYPTFRKYLEMEGLRRCLPGVETMEEGVGIYRQFYTEEDEFTYGVVALELQ